jgi:hypothetical protein|tara:strand:+ start:809 stop:1768 length:960 start_codon:yes stop_codon:yes gene_type:complete
MSFFKKNNSFFISLSASILFFIGYFILGSAGLITTLEPQESIGDISRWCERVSSGIFREPVNALSNLGFMFIGLLIFWTLSKDKEGNENQFIGLTTISILYASVVIFLGPGSLLMHGTHSYWGQWIDNVSMVMFIILPWLLNIKHLARWTDKTFFATYVSIVISFSLLSWFFGTNMGINLDLFGVSIALWVISEILYRFWSPSLRVLSGFVGFFVAAIFGIMPSEIFGNLTEYWWIILFWFPALFSSNKPMTIRVYSPWFFLGMGTYMLAFVIWLQGYPGTKLCNPDSLIQPHGIWHLLTAFSTLCFFKFFRTEKLITK